jgi:ADP-heptose:LPS heptosyltransferase
MRLLLIRFSAMGDVCIALPILKQLIDKHPEAEIHFISRKSFEPIFKGQPKLVFHGLDINKDFGGIFGIFRLLKYVWNIRPSIIIDLHDVLRTKCIRTVFQLFGRPVFVINKGRKEKKALVKGLIKERVKSTSLRYLEAIQKSGFLAKEKLLNDTFNHFSNLTLPQAFEVNPNYTYIGVAPFAAHETKMWPLDKYETVFAYFQKNNPEIKFLVFGGGNTEKETIDTSFSKFLNVENIIGKYSLAEELAILPNLKTMLAMDSANMHLAYLAGIPVISIWGSTHSFAGFALPDSPMYPRIEISKDILTCRPCSIYGNIPCRRSDHACMQNIAAEQVVEKILRFI